MDYADSSVVTSSQVEMTMVAGGAEFDMADLAERGLDLIGVGVGLGAVEIAGRVEGMANFMKADRDGDPNNLYQVQRIHGLRGEVEMGMPGTFGGIKLRPYLTVGYRLDSGADVEGEALEYGAGLRVRTSSLSFDGAVRSQTLQDKGDFERDSYSLSVGYEGGNDGRGLRFGLRTRGATWAGRTPLRGRCPLWAATRRSARR